MEPGGRGGRQISEATKKKIKLKLSGKNCYMFGIPKSEEIKNKISNTLKGTHLSNETKQKISNTMKDPSFQKIRYDEDWSNTASKMQKGIRLCTWIIKDFNTNKDYKTSNLGDFCLKHNLIYETLRGSFKHKNPIKTGKCAGWKIISKTEWK